MSRLPVAFCVTDLRTTFVAAGRQRIRGEPKMTRNALTLSTLAAAFAIAGAAIPAAAQSTAVAGSAGRAEPPNVAAILNGAAGAQKLAPGVTVTRSTTLASGPSAIALGWNFGHASNCGWFQDSAGNQYYYVSTSEGAFVSEAN